MATNWEVREALEAIRKTDGDGLTVPSVRAHPVLTEGYESAETAHAALIALCARVEGRPGEALKCALRLPPYTIHGIVERRKDEGAKYFDRQPTTIWSWENKGIEALTHLITGDDGPIAPEHGYTVDQSLLIDPDELEVAARNAPADLLLDPAELPIAYPRMPGETEPPQWLVAKVDQLASLNSTLMSFIRRQDLRISELEDALNRKTARRD